MYGYCRRLKNLLNYPTRYLALQVSWGFKYTSVETEINKKMSRMKKRQNFHPVLVREKIAPGKQPTFGDATRRVL